MLGIIYIILVIVNWVLYHKIFDVYYFGGLGKGLLVELVGCWIAAAIELAIIQVVGGWLITIVLVIGGIIAAIFAVVGIIKLFKKIFGKQDEKNTEQSNLNNNEEVKTEENLYSANDEKQSADVCEIVSEKNVKEEKEPEKRSDTIFCTGCGKQILRKAKFCTFCGNKNTYNN